MKKIIVSIIFIGLIFNGMFLAVGKSEATNLEIFLLKSQQNETIYVLVDSDIYSEISNSLIVYQNDLENEGYNVEIYIVNTENPEDVRMLLKNSTQNLVGAVLIGKIPVALANISEESCSHPFACDLYYMDLNGTWIDIDGDGIPDDYSGDYKPEIWIGRLKADTLTFGNKTEIELLQNYFYKNHKYRIYGSPFPNTALNYHGVGGSGPGYKLPLLYDNITAVDNENASAEDYKDKLLQGYEWVEIMCHSNAKLHAIQSGGEPAGYVYNKDIQQIDPHGCFYNLKCCYVCDYTQPDYIAGWYTFADTYGLVTLGETTTAGGANFYDFYESLSNGFCFGVAIKEMLTIYLEYQSRWGMTIIGDPSLKPKHQADPPSSNPPYAPSIIGSIAGIVNISYNFSFVTTDPDGDQVYYYVDWGDGSNNGWLGPYDSGEILLHSHTWSQPGTYEIKVKSTDINCVDSEWSFHEIIIIENNPPYAPSVDGPTNGNAGTEYEYTLITTDPDDNAVLYYIEWGDTTNTSWVGPYASDIEVIISHTWELPGAYTIRAKAKDSIYGVESDWSDPLFVTMPKNQQVSQQQQSQHLQSVSQQIMTMFLQRLIVNN